MTERARSAHTHPLAIHALQSDLCLITCKMLASDVARIIQPNRAVVGMRALHQNLYDITLKSHVNLGRTPARHLFCPLLRARDEPNLHDLREESGQVVPQQQAACCCCCLVECKSREVYQQLHWLVSGWKHHDGLCKRRSRRQVLLRGSLGLRHRTHAPWQSRLTLHVVRMERVGLGHRGTWICDTCFCFLHPII